MDIENMDTDSLSNLQVTKEKELREAQNNANLVENIEIDIAKEIIKLQLQRKDIQGKVSKARHVVRQLQSELRQIKLCYWQTKNQ